MKKIFCSFLLLNSPEETLPEIYAEILLLNEKYIKDHILGNLVINNSFVFLLIFFVAIGWYNFFVYL